MKHSTHVVTLDHDAIPGWGYEGQGHTQAIQSAMDSMGGWYNPTVTPITPDLARLIAAVIADPQLVDMAFETAVVHATQRGSDPTYIESLRQFHAIAYQAHHEERARGTGLYDPDSYEFAKDSGLLYVGD